ncbi:MAG TPA: hypothetical protein VJ783_03975 [Pirellulales bacterium]|nr:hypothetical protein [Pirellulales bacterium]
MPSPHACYPKADLERAWRYWATALGRLSNTPRLGGQLVYAVTLAILAFVVVPPAPSGSMAPSATSEAASWQERDWRVWFQSHQMYHCGPEELDESELDEVRRWCRCLSLLSRCHGADELTADALTDDECAFLVDALQDLVPNLEEHFGYQPLYESCRRRASVSVNK